MPMYEYECKKCHQKTEEIQKFSDAPLTTCAACGGELFRPLQRPSFQLKGGGWYADGYASAKKEGGNSGSDSANSSSKSGGDSKPASDAGSTPATTSGKTETKTTSPAPSSDSGKKPSGCCGGGCGGH